MARTLLLVLLLGVALTMISVHVIAHERVEVKDLRSLQATDCQHDNEWTWTKGPSQPKVAAQARQALRQLGIEALVEAHGFGETDACGYFRLYAVDFAIIVKAEHPVAATERRELTKQIYPLLAEFGKPNLGDVKIEFLFDDTVITSQTAPDSNAGLLLDNPGEYIVPAAPSLKAFDRNVYVIVYDPVLSNGQKLSSYLNWHDHASLTQGTIDLFKQVTNNRLNYTVTFTTIITDGWPEKADGFIYTEEEYLDVIAGQSPPHNPDGVDYNKIVNSPELDICGKANRGEIDEVWIYNGPYFGFFESTLVGPGAYWYNSPPVPGPHDCNRLIPIMGPSPERELDSAVHNFGHRTEATMTQVYGSWQQNRTDHNWERFALVKALSPDYFYSGCGNIHYPPNGASDYDYGNASTVLSNCDDFASYPDLGDPTDTAQPVTCSAWNCEHLDYLAYWFNHLPSNNGCGPDQVANDWWEYFVDPALALEPSAPCNQPPTPEIDFSASPTSGTAPLKVTFILTNTGGPITQHKWTFGDNVTSSLPSPSHTYTITGVYTVSLQVAGPGGSDHVTKTNYVVVSSAHLAPQVDFSGTPTYGAPPLKVMFTITNTGGPITHYRWDFGDDITGSHPSPSHTYTITGIYTVSLAATGLGGSDLITKTGYIAVASPQNDYSIYLPLVVRQTNAMTATVEVDASTGWQPTGIPIEQDTQIILEVTEGQWTHWLGTAPYNPGTGGAYVCAAAIPADQCVEPLPDFPTGALIGQIGTQVFGIGSGSMVTAAQSGELFLRINDSDDGLYDNDGKLTVSITVEK